MKLIAYNCRSDELDFFKYYSREFNIELVTTREIPAMDNVELVRGCQAVSVITTAITADLIEAWKELGVRAISTRTIGFEHVDYRRARQLGISVSSVAYSANTVADYAIMTMMMALRKMKTIMIRSIGQDYSLRDIRGAELPGKTVGIIGTGRIGETVIRHLSGFGCRLLAYDLYQKDSVKQFGEYVDLETIWKECDIISLHTPATDGTYHMVNKESLAQMKDGVIIINTARGSLIDTGDFIEALENGKVGAAALDVVEHEMGIYYSDFKYKPVGHHQMAILDSMPNVLMTPHTAFFTDQAVSDMVEYSIEGCVRALEGRENPWEIHAE